MKKEDEERYQYTKGFNHGYFMRQHDPGLLEKILKGVKGDSRYLDGMKGGMREYRKEQFRKNMEKLQESRGREGKRMIL